MNKMLLLSATALMLLSGCTQETQNKIGRTIQNYTGTDGVVDVYAGEKLVNRFLKVDKLTTAVGTQSNETRPYRYGYGYMDTNFNFIVDKGEKKVYFEISNYSTSYIFYENPKG